MRYIIEEQLQDPERSVVEVVGPSNERSILRREHSGANEYIVELRKIVVALRKHMRTDAWWEHPDGVRVDIVGQRELDATYEHVNLLILMARAIELELYSPEMK